MSAVLVVGHRCGHVREHQYASQEAANAAKQKQAAQACPECRERPKSDQERAKVAEMSRARRARKDGMVCPHPENARHVVVLKGPEEQA